MLNQLIYNDMKIDFYRNVFRQPPQWTNKFMCVRARGLLHVQSIVISTTTYDFPYAPGTACRVQMHR